MRPLIRGRAWQGGEEAEGKGRGCRAAQDGCALRLLYRQDCLEVNAYWQGARGLKGEGWIARLWMQLSKHTSLKHGGCKGWGDTRGGLPGGGGG